MKRQRTASSAGIRCEEKSRSMVENHTKVQSYEWQHPYIAKKERLNYMTKRKNLGHKIENVAIFQK